MKSEGGKRGLKTHVALIVRLLPHFWLNWERDGECVFEESVLLQGRLLQLQNVPWESVISQFFSTFHHHGNLIWCHCTMTQHDCIHFITWGELLERCFLLLCDCVLLVSIWKKEKSPQKHVRISDALRASLFGKRWGKQCWNCGRIPFCNQHVSEHHEEGRATATQSSMQLTQKWSRIPWNTSLTGFRMIASSHWVSLSWGAMRIWVWKSVLQHNPLTSSIVHSNKWQWETREKKLKKTTWWGMIMQLLLVMHSFTIQGHSFSWTN